MSKLGEAGYINIMEVNRLRNCPSDLPKKKKKKKSA
jgi:hypothetical protein